MADHIAFVEAAGESFGWQPNQYIKAYDIMCKKGMADTLLDNPLGTMIEKWLEFHFNIGVLEGKSRELYLELESFMLQYEEFRKHKDNPKWPKNEEHFGIKYGQHHDVVSIS